MNQELFERLLYEEESTTLDFKKEQYLFAKATEEEKSELLKDILGFANAWRRAESYILIGVVDVRGGRGTVVGIPATDQLNDHSLQQFVTNLTNRPVRFHYEAYESEGKQVGVIRIEEQPRPLYLKKDYGKLKKNEVYVRRGSSTDPTKPATPEEIAQMGHNLGPQNAEVIVEFAEMKRDDTLGAHISWSAEFCKMPATGSIPDLVHPRRQRLSGLGIDLLSFQDPMNRLNEDYFRELAKFEFVRRLYRPIRLLVRNAGEIAAHDVRAEINVRTNIGAVVISASDLPDPPRRHADYLHLGDMRISRPAFLRSPGDVSIDKNEERFRIEVNCGSLQPGRRVWSDIFYIGKGETGDLPLNGQIFANNLPQPKDFNLLISVEVMNTHMSVAELTSLPEPRK